MRCKLSDVCSFRKGKIKVDELDNKTYVSTENMLSNKAGIMDAASLPATPLTQAYKTGDVLVSNIRPYFKKIWRAKHNGGCSNDVLVFEANENIEKDFLYYLLADDAFFAYAAATSKGTKMPRGDKASIMQYEIPVFDRHTQSKIASVLRAIDDKIETNQAINENLEQQALLIFQRELLRNGELPERWTTGSLLDIANYLNGLAMQKFRPVEDALGLPVLKIRELRQGFCDTNSELCSQNIKPEYIIHDGDVVFSWSGSLLVDLWCGGTCGLNQHLFKVTSDKYPKWFYYAWTAHYLTQFATIAADKATTMGHIKREELAKAEVIIPDADSIERIGKVLQPVYNLIIRNRVENRKLAVLRDTILPRLLSGKIDVSAVQL